MAFNNHCDEIKERAKQKFEALPESDQDGRRKILEEEKSELDKTLSELRQLFASKGSQVRRQLEEIAQLKEQESFGELDDQLSML